MAALLCQRRLLPFFKGKIMKVIISIVLSRRQRSIYDQGACLLWQGKNGQKSQFFFPKQHYVAGLRLMYFTFWVIP